MKKIYFALFAILAGYYCAGQNTFPASGNVGIGTTSPIRALDIVSSTSTGNTPFINIVNTSGATPNSFGPGIVLDNRVSGKSPFIINERQDVTSRFSISRANSPYTDYLCILQNGNVLIGNWYQVNSSYKLDVSGNVRANKVVVNTTGADYVFDSTYHLTSIDSLRTFIKEHHHLPEIPSARKLKDSGADIGEMQRLQLQKIEELTLYLIEKDEEISELKHRISLLEKKEEQAN